jgi:hypothetical protein
MTKKCDAMTQSDVIVWESGRLSQLGRRWKIASPSVMRHTGACVWELGREEQRVTSSLAVKAQSSGIRHWSDALFNLQLSADPGGAES